MPLEDREAFAKALPEHSRLTNLEEGCVYFRVTACKDVEGRYLVEEAFLDEEAYDAHVHRAQKTGWVEITQNIIRSYTHRTLHV